MEENILSNKRKDGDELWLRCYEYEGWGNKCERHWC